ncbi:hypothetical protein [Frigoribacterium sp. PvP032]|uniref:hypothetical protein n=1 Tax=Frigoribacterium sp. PvP032 TaxID=2806589 RepID=UPI001AE9E08B|nr:hypothetical protein [Frigoribacterium sp. PvP032]MBP1189199.1 hypothetical protein [Frigoribacterium sp. PvP032]
MTTPWDSEALWLKSRMFVNRAMDPDREFEEQAFWAAAALELLGKAALVRISPMLIAHPDDDGRSILLASGAVDYTGIFGSVQAKAIWSRCARVFRTFNEAEARKIAAGRNGYIHSTGVGFDAIPQAVWWPRYWAQAFILVEHLDRTIVDLVGPSRSLLVTKYLAENKEYVAQRLATLKERANSLLSRHRSGSLSARLETEWQRFDLATYLYTEPRECVACGATGEVGGDEVIESHMEYPEYSSFDPEDQFSDPRSITLDIAPFEFNCPVCHLVLDEPELLDEAGLSDPFQAEGDPEDMYDDGPEYENE